jgi:hypothetical protein
VRVLFRPCVMILRNFSFVGGNFIVPVLVAKDLKPK